MNANRESFVRQTLLTSKAFAVHELMSTTLKQRNYEDFFCDIKWIDPNFEMLTKRSSYAHCDVLLLLTYRNLKALNDICVDWGKAQGFRYSTFLCGVQHPLPLGSGNL